MPMNAPRYNAVRGRARVLKLDVREVAKYSNDTAPPWQRHTQVDPPQAVSDSTDGCETGRRVISMCVD
jgi:hypothetical protein